MFFIDTLSLDSLPIIVKLSLAIIGTTVICSLGYFFIKFVNWFLFKD